MENCCVYYIVSVMIHIKILLLAFDCFFWVTGTVILAAGVWIRVDLYKYLVLSSMYQPDIPFVMIGVGAFIVLFGCLSCCCTIKGHPLLLYTLSAFLFIIFFIEFFAGIDILINKEQVKEGFKDDLVIALQKYDESEEKTITDAALDGLQKKLLCCGIDSYTDWYNTPYSRTKTGHSVPVSCCSVRYRNCHHNGQTRRNLSIMDIYTQGCYPLSVSAIERNIGLIGWIALGFSFFQILGATLTVWMAKSINRFTYEQIT